MNENPMEVFRKEAPEVAAAFNDLIQSLLETKGLDQKTRQLLYIAMKASMGDERGGPGTRAHGKGCGGDQSGGG